MATCRAIAAVFGLLSGPAAHAITINVTTFDDELNNDGDCSLREAVVAVNTTAPRDACPGSSSETVIRLQAGTYDVTGKQLLRRSASIEGAGMEKTILNWRLAEGGIVANKAADGDPAVVLGLKRVRLEGVRNSGGGGCLVVVRSATLDVEDSAIVNCRAETGGGIHNSGVTSIKRSLLDSNHASERGGGIESVGTMTVEQSTLRRNRALTGTGRGGGIYSNGTLTLTNSTLSQNKSLWGGGLFNVRRATLRNVTVAFNEAENGGGLHHFPSPNTSLVLAHTIVARNTTAALVPTDCHGTLTSEGYNLVGVRNCTLSGGQGDQTGTAAAPLDPRLGTLKRLGTLTPIHDLLVDSPAIDRGLNTMCPAVDQRGMRRRADGDQNGSARCDIGAVERGVVVLVVDVAANAAGDHRLIDILQVNGLVVIRKDDDDVDASDAFGASVILVSSSVESVKVQEAYRNVEVGVVVMEPALFDDMKMTGNADGTDYGLTDGQTQLVIPAGSLHALAAGLSGTVTTTATSAGPVATWYTWGVPAGPSFCATLSGSSGCGLFGYTTGSTMVGDSARAPRVGLFVTPDAAAVLSDAGKALFNAALYWAAGL